MNKFIAKPLPYTMGNAGDLIKHGLISEFLNWYLKKDHKQTNFYDPFGGRPWQEPIDNEVSNRLRKLEPCSLKDAQTNFGHRYFGSSHIVKNTAKINQRAINIFSSDRDSEARTDLINSGMEAINLGYFDYNSGYSILKCQFPKNVNSIILIDPFYDLKKIKDTILENIIHLVSNQSVIVFLYVLYKNDDISLWNDFQKKRMTLIQDKISCHSLTCEPIINSSIKGEGKFYSHISLFMNEAFSSNDTQELVTEITDFSDNLSKILCININYNHSLTK